MFTYQGYSQNAEGHADAKVHYTIKCLPGNKPWTVEHYIRVAAELEKRHLKNQLLPKRILDESIDRYLMGWKYCLIGQNILCLWNSGRNGHVVSRGQRKHRVALVGSSMQLIQVLWDYSLNRITHAWKAGRLKNGEWRIWQEKVCETIRWRILFDVTVSLLSSQLGDWRENTQRKRERDNTF